MGRKERRIAKEMQPPRFGPKKDDEVTCYSIMIPNLPLIPSKKVMDFIKWVNELEGFLGLYPNYPFGTALIFDTENNAKGGRNLMRSYPGIEFPIGEISECYVEKKYLRG